MSEIWKVINGYEKYEISNIGNVRKGKLLLSPQVNQCGYIVIRLTKNKKRYHNSIHRLVAIAFIPNIDNLKEVNHIDGNKLNNDYTNLEWSSRSKNIQHAYDTGLKIALSGINHPQVTLSKEICLKIQDDLNEGKLSKTNIAKKYNTNRKLVYNIQHKIHWSMRD
jgi:hypothetical protein